MTLRRLKFFFIFSSTFVFLSFFPSSSFAWKPVTHVYLSDIAMKDALDDGEVTIYHVDYEGGKVLGEVGRYKVDPTIYKLLRHYGASYLGGTFGPDAYPDMITGGMVVHADRRPIGASTNEWLEYLWKNGFEGNSSYPAVQAWTLGYLTHAAGDMYIHTFINYYAGGIFEIDDGNNAARHILFEGYIAKRQPGPRSYDVAFVKDVGDFIYKYMVDATPGSVLDTKLLKVEAGAKLSPPRRFSDLRAFLQERFDNDAWDGMRKPFKRYAQEWIKDIDTGLRAWVDLSQDLAMIVFMGSESDPYDGKKETKKDKAVDRAQKYVHEHLMSMCGLPDQAGPAAEYLGSLLPEAIKEFTKSIRDGLLDYIFMARWGITYAQAKEYAKYPEKHFDEVIGAKPGKVNFDARPVTLAEANKILKLKDPGFEDPSETYRLTDFPPAFNTVQLTKLLFLAPDEVNRMMKDLKKLTKQKGVSAPTLEKPNIILGFCPSIDASNSWKTENPKMILAREGKFYVQVFMKQTGEDPFPPFLVEPLAPPGGVISKISVAPGYLKDFDFKEFKPKKFVDWFAETAKSKVTREIYGRPKTAAERKEPKTDDPEKPKASIANFFEEIYSLADDERKLLKQKSELKIDLEYIFWSFPEENVEIKIVPFGEEERTEFPPFTKTFTPNEDKDFIQDKGQITVPVGEFNPDKTAATPIGFELYVNNQLAHRAYLKNVFTVEEPSEDYDRANELLREMEKLLATATTAVGDARTFCQQTASAINSCKSSVAAIKIEVAEIEKKLKTVGSVAGGAQQSCGEIEKFHKNAETTTGQLGDMAVKLDDASNLICDQWQKMKDADTNLDRQNAYAAIMSAQNERAGLAQRAESELPRVKGMTDLANRYVLELKEAKEALDSITGFATLLSNIAQCERQLEAAIQSLMAARGKVNEILELKKQAATLAQEIRKLMAKKKSEQAKEILKKMNPLVKQFDDLYNSVQGCPAYASSSLTTVTDDVTKLRKRLTGLDLRLKDLYTILGDPGVQPESISKAIEQAGLLDYLYKMAEQYVKRIRNADQDAQTCLDFANQIKDIPVSVVLPDFRNQHVNQALGILRGWKISATPVEEEKAADPQYEYVVKGQVPAGGTEVKIKDAQVTLYHYGELDVDQYLARVDCSAKPFSHAELDPGTRQARCVCNPGYPPTDDDKCLDCNYYQAQCNAALAANNLDAAYQWAVAAQLCPWAGNVIGQILKAKCQTIEGQIRGVMSQKPVNVGLANQLVDQAHNMGCQLGADIYQTLAQLMQQQRQQQQQATVDMMQNIFDLNKWLPPDQGPVTPPDGGNQGGGQNNTQSGLSDVTVNTSPTQITVWDSETEDFDTVNLYLNNQLVQANVVLRKAKQSFTLYLNWGNNTLRVEAVNEGDPEINRRQNLSPGNSAAIEISHVTSGRQSQSWVLSTGQSGTMTIKYQP